MLTISAKALGRKKPLFADWSVPLSPELHDGSVSLRFRLPDCPEASAFQPFNVDYIVTVSELLKLELVVMNNSKTEEFVFENCLHTYFQTGDINSISISGLENSSFDDFAAGAGGARKPAKNSLLRITKETNRVYFDSTHAVEIRDETFKRVIRVEKLNSKSTVVWNPWTTQKLPEDFDRMGADYEKFREYLVKRHS